MNIFLLVFIFSYTKEAAAISKKIADDVINYFNDGNIRAFSEKWETHRLSVENALELALQQTFGKPGLNVYIKSVDDPHKVSEGFLMTDKVVFVLFRDLNLARYPYLRNPRVWFPLASNVLRVEAYLSKMLIHSEYLLFRNYTDVVYPTGKDEKESNISPFARHQVQSRGQATIIAENCLLHGDSVALLRGFSVNLGYDNFELDNCQFSVEISNPEIGAPPVIVPYFTLEQGAQLSRKLMITLLDELRPKLQSAVHSIVNTTAMLGNIMKVVRQQQRTIFKKTGDYATEVIGNLNRIVSEGNRATQLWKSHQIMWKNMEYGQEKENIIILSNMSLSGLDSAYTGRSGGPVKTDSIKLIGDLRYAGLQINGEGYVKMDGTVQKFKFSSEVQDVMVKGTVDVSPSDGGDKPLARMAKEVRSLHVSGWRNVEIFGPPNPQIDTYAWIVGVLLRRVPIAIIKLIAKHYDIAVDYTEKPFDINAETLNIPDSGENPDPVIGDYDFVERSTGDNEDISEETKPDETGDENLIGTSTISTIQALYTEDSEESSDETSDENSIENGESTNSTNQPRYWEDTVKNKAKEAKRETLNKLMSSWEDSGSDSGSTDESSGSDDSGSSDESSGSDGRKHNKNAKRRLLHKHPHTSDNEIRSE